MSEETIDTTNLVDSSGAATFARLLQHLREPGNLLNYLALSAWIKFMGAAQYIPTITVGA